MTATRPQERKAHPGQRDRPDGFARPRVVFLGRNLVVGGAERAFLSYVHQARTIEPIVVLLERRGELLPELRANVRSVDLSAGLLGRGPVANVLDEIPGWTGVRLARECRLLAGVVRQTGAPVICSFLMRAHLVALLTKRFLVPDVKVVLNIHEHWSDSARYLYPRRRDQLMMRWITRHLFPKADGVVAVATALRDDLVQRHGIPAGHVKVAFNPVDLSRVRDGARDELPLADLEFMRRPTIVGVGRLVPLKGFDLLIRAFAEVRRSIDARLMLIGDGEERHALTALAAEAGVADSVRLVGWQPNPWRYIARAAAVAVTSHTEAFPYVLSEALALGVPTLSTDCSPGIHELLDRGDSGLIVPSREPRSIADGLIRLLTDEPLRASVVARGLERVKAFEPGVAVHRYEMVVRELAFGGNPVPAGVGHASVA